MIKKENTNFSLPDSWAAAPCSSPPGFPPKACTSSAAAAAARLSRNQNPSYDETGVHGETETSNLSAEEEPPRRNIRKRSRPQFYTPPAAPPKAESMSRLAAHSRTRSTASARRESAQQRHQAQFEAQLAEEQMRNQMDFNNEDAPHNEEADDNANNDEDDDELLRSPFPGGPTDISVLRSFKTHVAAAIWRGEEREVLKCYCLTKKLLKWPPVDNSNTWRDLVKRSGLLQLRKLAYKAPNRNLITTFVERWQPETNSFHLPFGEMTITLEDVYCLTGLSIEGRPVQLVGEDVAGGQHTLRHLLGVSTEEANTEVSDRGSYVKLKWLHDRFGDLTSSDNDNNAVYAARAFLVYILGCTIFADKTGDRVSTNYLRLFEDPVKFEGYAWGTAALSFLYRQLGVASRVGVRQISGFLTLLEAWIYEHFPTLGRPQQNVEYCAVQPYAMRWAQHAHGSASENAVKAYRAQLDALRAEDVVWDPYVSRRDGGERPEVTFYEGCITACDIVEPYLPDRVLRQFGRMQTIPHALLDPVVSRRGKKPGQYRLVWGMCASFFDEWDSHKLSLERRGRLAYPSWACSPNYLQWFCSISHPRVQNEATAPDIAPAPTVPRWDGIHSATEYLDPIRVTGGTRKNNQIFSIPSRRPQEEMSCFISSDKITKDQSSLRVNDQVSEHGSQINTSPSPHHLVGLTLKRETDDNSVDEIRPRAVQRSSFSAEDIEETLIDISLTEVPGPVSYEKTRDFGCNNQISEGIDPKILQHVANALQCMAESQTLLDDEKVISRSSDINKNLVHTLEAINIKHGDITRDCWLESDCMKTLVLLGICKVVQDLQKKELKDLDISSLDSYYTTVRDAENMKVNVQWLRSRLDEIKDAFNLSDEANGLIKERDRRVGNIDRKKKELSLLKSDLERLKYEVQDIEEQLAQEAMMVEELNTKFSNQMSKISQLQHANLMDGLI